MEPVRIFRRSQSALREHRDAARILEAVAKTTCSNEFKNSGIACSGREGRSARWWVDREADRVADLADLEDLEELADR
jgi:hypothetical protein